MVEAKITSHTVPLYSLFTNPALRAVGYALASRAKGAARGDSSKA